MNGQLAWGDTLCGAGSAIVVEAGVDATVRASEPARILHFGPVSAEPPTEGPLGPADIDRRDVHVWSEHDVHVKTYEGHPFESRFYTDGSCPTCRLALFEIRCPQEFRTVSHIHTEDEIIHVLEGELQVGPTTVTAGSSLSIPRGVRYALKSNGPFRFLNYRSDLAAFIGTPGSEPILERV
jgi:hypothetical protein